MIQDRKLILNICTGNICRSPMAEKLLQRALTAEGAPLNSLTVESAGIAASCGLSASKNSIIAIERFGIDLTQHRSQPVTQALIDRTFLILGMTDSHLDLLKHYNLSLPTRMHLFREFIGVREDMQIPDPYGENLAAYRACLDSMIEAIPSLMNYLRKIYV